MFDLKLGIVLIIIKTAHSFHLNKYFDRQWKSNSDLKKNNNCVQF